MKKVAVASLYIPKTFVESPPKRETQRVRTRSKPFPFASLKEQRTTMQSLEHL